MSVLTAGKTAYGRFFYCFRIEKTDFILYSIVNRFTEETRYDP